MRIKKIFVIYLLKESQLDKSRYFFNWAQQVLSNILRKCVLTITVM